MPDKYTATWTSHTSISDFLQCPRAYYLKHVYKDSKTNHKVKVMTPPLALGSSVHEVLESLSILPRDQRFTDSLITKFDDVWEKISGEKGGFANDDVEHKYKKRSQEMLRRVVNDPGPIKELSVKIQKELPYFWLDEEENIILCGKVDWLQYFPDSDSVHIIDFKTGQKEESKDSLQLSIYHLLVSECQKRKVSRASYWYLAWSDTLQEMKLPDIEEAREEILNIARDMKLARQLKRFKCPKGEDGCFACRPMELVVNGKAEFVGTDDFNYDVYILNKVEEEEGPDSVIL